MRAAAALVLSAALLAGCGSDGDKRFADRGNAICRETKRKSVALAPQTPNYRAKLSAIGRDGHRRLKALEPPPHLRATRDRFFADLAELQRLAVRQGNRAKAVDIVNRLPVEARALGWGDCAG